MRVCFAISLDEMVCTVSFCVSSVRTNDVSASFLSLTSTGFLLQKTKNVVKKSNKNLDFSPHLKQFYTPSKDVFLLVICVAMHQRYDSI